MSSTNPDNDPPSPQRSPSSQGPSAAPKIGLALAFYLICMLAIGLFEWQTLMYPLFGVRTVTRVIYVTITDNPPVATPTPTPTVRKIGDTITIEGLAVTLLSTEIIPGDQTVQPRPGNTFVLAHLEFSNLTTAPVDPNPYDFHVTSGSGNYLDYHDHEIVWPAPYTTANEVGAERLAPGDTINRDLLVQAPIGDHAAELTWEPYTVSGIDIALGTCGWNLGL